MPNHFSGLPFRSNAGAYEKCVEAVVRLAKHNPSVGAVYRFGGPWQPGISDLDIVLVYRDFKASVPDPWHVTDEAARIFTHRYLSMAESDVENFFLFYPERTSILTHLWGTEYPMRHPQKEFSPDEYHLLLALALTDVFCNKLFSFPLMARGVAAGRAHVRSVIGALYSLVYTGDLFEELGLSREGAFEEKIRALRAGWFEQPEAENLRELALLADEGVHVVERMARLLSAWLAGRGLHATSTLRNRRLFLKGSSEWTELSINEDKVLGGGMKRSLEIPAPLMGALSLQAEGEGPWSTLMRRALTGHLAPSAALSRAAMAYTHAANQYFMNVLASHGLYRMPYPYGFGQFDWRHPLTARLAAHLPTSHASR